VKVNTNVGLKIKFQKFFMFTFQILIQS